MPPQTEEASETRDIPCDDERDVYDHVNDGGGISAAFFFGLEKHIIKLFSSASKKHH